MKQTKRIMLLGGIRYLLPVIEAAHKQGYYVITADYIPDNIAHKYSDKYINLNIVDKEAVLAAAKAEKIDGIMSFGVDPGVISAAYVQEQLGLPAFGPYESVVILQNKDKFRHYLEKNGFNVPWSFAFSSVASALKDKKHFTYPLMVKPTDSAGSKGCTKVENEASLEQALEYAMTYSISKHLIVEEFIEKSGSSSDSDCFSVDGELKYVSFSAQRFDSNAPNPFAPSAYSWPSTFSKEQEIELTHEIQRLLTLLHMQTSIYNIETRIGTNGKTYIMEVSPRGGGNRLAEMLRFASGVDMITACVCAAVGDPIPTVKQIPYNGHWAEVILHAQKDGVFKELTTTSIQEYVIQTDLWITQGDHIKAFKGANDAIGTLVLKFPNQLELEKTLENIHSHVQINYEA